MAGIIAHVDDDISKLRALKKEIEGVKASLTNINVKVDIDIKQGLEAQLKSLVGQYDALAQKIAETEGRIANSVANINSITEKIISGQNRVIEETRNSGGPAGGQSTAGIEQANAEQAHSYNELRQQIEAVIGSKAANLKLLHQEEVAIRSIKGIIAELNKAEEQNGYLTDKQRAYLDRLNEELVQRKQAVSELNIIIRQQVKEEQAAEGSMKQLGVQLGLMRAAYRDLTEAEKDSPFGKQLLASIQQADDAIKGMDATIGNYQRNVGNYASGWNGLNMSIQQLARELPSLAYGPQIFFSAISNNLPILADELKRATAEYNRLKAAGENATPVWKQILTSLVSWQTALTVGITLLTVYGKEIWEWVKSLFSANSELEKMRENLTSISANISVSIQVEVNQVNALFESLKKAAKGSNEYKVAQEAIMKNYGKYLKDLKNEKDELLDLEAAYLRVADAIKTMAQERALEKVLNGAQDKYSKVFDEQTQIILNALKERFDRFGRGRAIVDNFYQLIMNDVENLGGLSEDTKLSLKKSLGVAYNKGNTDETYTDITAAVRAIRDARTTFDKEYSEAQTRLATGKNEYLELSKEELRIRKNAIKDALAWADKEGEVVAYANGKIVGSYKDRVEAELALQKIESAIKDSGKRVEVPKSDKELRAEEQARTAAARAENRLQKIEEEQANKRKKNRYKTANELEQLEIDLMQEGTAKKMRQLNLDFAKEVQAIEAWEDEIKAAKIAEARAVFEANPANKDKVFDSSTVDTSLSDDESKLKTQKQINALTAFLNKRYEINKEASDKEANALAEYIRNYGTYLQRKELLEKEHLQRLADLRKSGAGKNQINLENANYNASVQSLDEQFGKTPQSMADLFEDASRKSVREIQKIIDKYKSLLKLLSSGGATPEALKNLGFSDSEIQKIRTGQINLKDLGDAIKTLEEGVANRSPFNAFIQGLEDSFALMKKTEKQAGKVGLGIMGIGESITAFMPALSEFSSNIASIFGFDDGAIQDALGAVGGVGQAASGIGQMMSGDIVGGLMSAASGIASVVSSIKSLADRDNETRIKKLQGKVEELQDSYEKASKEVDSSYSYDKAEAIQAQNENLEKQQAQIQQMIAEEEAKKDTDNERIKEWKKQLEDINALIEENKQAMLDAVMGEDLVSAIDRFASSYADAVASGTSKWEGAKNFVKDSIKKMTMEAIKGALQSSEAIAKIRAKLDEFFKDGIITIAEENQLNEMAEKAMAELDAKFGWANRFMADDTTEQEAASRGISSLTQEQGEELNGRFTALQIAGEAIRTQSEEQTQQMALLVTTSAELKAMSEKSFNALEGVNDQIAQMYLEVQEINANTSASASYLKVIKDDIAAVKKNTENLV